MLLNLIKLNDPQKLTPYKNHLFINKKFNQENNNYYPENDEENRKKIKEAVYSNQDKIFQNKKDIKLSRSIASPNAHAEINKRNN